MFTFKGDLIDINEKITVTKTKRCDKKVTPADNFTLTEVSDV